MIPDSIGAVVAFLLLIAPGFVWDRCAARYAPEAKETPLREIAQIALASLAASGISAAALAWVWIPVLRAGEDVITLLLASVATSLLACGITLLFAKWRLPGTGQMSANSVLYQAFETWADHEHNNGIFVVASLNDGTVWRGRYGAVDTGAEDLQPLIALRDPLSRRKLGEEDFYPYSGKQVVLLPLQHLTSMRLVQASRPGPSPHVESSNQTKDSGVPSERPPTL